MFVSGLFPLSLLEKDRGSGLCLCFSTVTCVFFLWPTSLTKDRVLHQYSRLRLKISGAQGLAARARVIQEAQDAALRDVREPIDPEVLDPDLESGPVWSALQDDPNLCIKLTRFPPRALRSLARACFDFSVPPRGRAPRLSVFDGVSLLMTFLATGIPIATIATIYRLKEDPVRTAIERARSLLHSVLCARHLQRMDRVRLHSVELQQQHQRNVKALQPLQPEASQSAQFSMIASGQIQPPQRTRRPPTNYSPQ